MAFFEWTLVLLAGAVLLAALARRIGVPYPALIALAGAALAFQPFAPAITVAPDLALALFIAPVLLDAAFDFSPRDLKRYAFSLASLAIVAVAITTAAVAFVGVRIGGLPIAASIALGAIVAPPDAAAAAAVLGQFRLPRRITAILGSESLFNDATALLIYRIAVSAAVGPFVWSHVAPMLLLSALGSFVVGYLLARIVFYLLTNVTDAASATVMQFVSTFGVWILADRLGLSAIITMVVYAMTIARSAPRRMVARNRISSYSVWETAVFVLNVLAFVLMGLQAQRILSRLTGERLGAALMLAVAVLATIVAVRLAWVLGCRALQAMARLRPVAGADAGDWRGDLVVGWCGMRGLVTLATAFALPADFPGRDPIVLTAFCVVLGTLVIQGVTLRPLIALLNFAPDRSIEREVSLARIAVMQAALDSLEGDESAAAAAVREQFAAARAVAEDTESPQGATIYDTLRLRTIAAQRDVLDRLRRSGEIGDEAYHRLEEEIDWAELSAAPAGSFQPLTT